MKVTSVRVRDFSGEVAETALYVNDETTTTDLENFRAKLAECLRSRIIQAQRTETLYTNTGNGLTGNYARVTSAALITFGAGSELWTLPFHGPEAGIFNEDGTLNVTNLAVIDLVDWLAAHVVGPLGQVLEFESGKLGLGFTASERVIAAATRTKSRGWDGRFYQQHGAALRVV